MVKVEPSNNDAAACKQPCVILMDAKNKTFVGRSECRSGIDTERCPCSYCQPSKDFVPPYSENNRLVAAMVTDSYHHARVDEGTRKKETMPVSVIVSDKDVNILFVSLMIEYWR